jgi:hypothetical protein
MVAETAKAARKTKIIPVCTFLFILLFHLPYHQFPIKLKLKQIVLLLYAFIICGRASSEPFRVAFV